jgi:hypothetical protein
VLKNLKMANPEDKKWMKVFYPYKIPSSFFCPRVGLIFVEKDEIGFDLTLI